MLFQSSLRRELARAFGATLVVILTIVITMMLIRTLGQAAGGVVSPQDVVLMLGYTAIGHLPTMLALSLFIAVVVALGRMYRDSEMAIWFASGKGLSEFVSPVLRMAWPVWAVIGVLLFLVWPWGNRSSVELRERYEARSDLSRVAPGQFQSSADGSRVFFVDKASREGMDASNVFVVTRQATVESVTSAKGGRLVTDGEERRLVLDHGQRAETDSATGQRTLAAFDRYEVVTGEAAVRGAQNRAPKTVDTMALLRDPQLRHQGELAWRLGMLAAAINLTLLGIGLAATNPRRASNWNLLFALLAFIVYFNLVNLSQAWIGAGRWAWAPLMVLLHGGGFCAALVLIWWREQGTVLRLWPARRAVPA